MNFLVKEYESSELFVVEPRQDNSIFAKKVTCKLCGEVLFDCERDVNDKIELVFHGLKAHYQIRHEITLGVAICADPDCRLKHGS